MKVLEWNAEVCTGCEMCVAACSFIHEQECGRTISRIKIIRDRKVGDHLAFYCLQCSEEYCVQACSVEALTRDEKTGAITVDAEVCNGCGLCVDSCPVFGIYLDDKGIAFKCDLCSGDPECVKWCSRDVLTIREGNPVSLGQKVSYLKEKSHLLAPNTPSLGR